MQLGDTLIEDTFAEAFGMRYARLLVTAHDDYWLAAAAREFTGYSASVIACDMEAGVERHVAPEETPDGRPGVLLLAFGFSTGALAEAVPRRAGQCLMTCPTTAVYDGLDPRLAPQVPATLTDDRLPLGKHLRYFGDGFQKSKLLDSVRYWRVPVMDGEFLAVSELRVGKGVAGGNIILQGGTADSALAAARRASEALAEMPGVITPFPGGVVRSGSKVGSRYAGMKASTSEGFCPTLRGRVDSQLHPEATCAYEIVIDGVDPAVVGSAMAAAMRAAARPGVVAISAGNYGGKLGKHHYALRSLLAAE